MHLEILIMLMLRSSITLMVFAVGLRVRPGDIAHLLHRPRLLIHSLLSMNLAMPLMTAALVAIFDFDPHVKIVLMMLSISPVPPLLPTKLLTAGRGSPYIFSLLVIEAAFAIVLVPASISILERLFKKPLHSSPVEVAIVLLITVLVPIAAGMWIGRVEAPIADRIAKPVSFIAALLLGCSALPILFIAMPTIISLIGNGTLAGIALFVLMGLCVGHLLGGPEIRDRIVLALSTASRHPAVALAAAGSSFSDEKVLQATLLLYMIVNAIASMAYLKLQRRRAAIIGSPNIVSP